MTDDPTSVRSLAVADESDGSTLGSHWIVVLVVVVVVVNEDITNSMGWFGENDLQP